MGAKRSLKRWVNGLWKTTEGCLLASIELISILIKNVHDLDHCARVEVISRI